MNAAGRFGAPGRLLRFGGAGDGVRRAGRGSEGDVCRLSDAQDRLVTGELLPGGPDGVDLIAIFFRVGVFYDKKLGTKALRCTLILSLPLSVDIDHAETVWKTRGDLLIKELTPAGLRDAIGGLIDSAETEVEFGVEPATGDAGMSGIAREGRSRGGGRRRRVKMAVCAAAESERGSQKASEKAGGHF